MTGTLYIVGTPIGNLEDITLRALKILREVEVIAAEDTRVTQTLLRRHAIETPLISYHQHSGEKRFNEILEMLKEGKSIALVSDAGMPGFSDPGARLVAMVAEAGIDIVVVPGPTASSAALAASGISGREHLFLGFLPSKQSARQKALAEVVSFRGALVMYEAPHRVLETLIDLRAVFGERQAVCGRELTKKFEELKRGSISELIAHFSKVEPRGEFTIVVSGATEKREPELVEVVAEVRDLQEAGLSLSRAVAHVAKYRGVPRNKLYKSIVEQETRSCPTDKKL